MKKVIYLLFLCVIFSCQNPSGNTLKISDDNNLRHILSAEYLEYKVVYELDELKQMNEGIYLAVIELSEKSFQMILSNIQKNDTVHIDNKYIAVNWQKTPITVSDFDFSVFNYSPVTNITLKKLEEMKSNIKKSANFYFYYYEKDYPGNIGLYVVDVSHKQIKIYQTYF
jgi:hypothetical protein